MELNFANSVNGERKARIARELCEQGLWPDVLAFAQKWREKEPGDYQALYYIGLGLSGMRQFSEAEAAYRSALTIESTDVKVWNNLAGLLYENLHRPVEAIRCLEQSLKMDPHNKLCWSNLATMVGRLGQHDKAMACADRAIALDPKLVEAYLHKGAAARALKKMDVVREVCHVLATIEPENFHRAR
jgi:tetratricopeptide (TPR) repeat protein